LVLKKLFQKPHLAFFALIPLILLMGFLNPAAGLDINVHDTYIVISYKHIAIFLAYLFLVLGLGYWVMQRTHRKLSQWLNAIHIILTIGGLTGLFLMPNVAFSTKLQSASPLFDGLILQNVVPVVLTILIALAQLLYIINLIIGILRKDYS